jgi:lysozyme
MDQPLNSSDTVELARIARLVRPFETLETRAVRRPGGGWSIGYGHVRSAREGAEVSREEADALLLYDLRHVARVVRSAIYAPVNRNQLEALTAFAFHIGIDSFLRSTTLQRFNAGDSLGAAEEIERWRLADLGGASQIVDALVRRRAAEKAHFLTPPQGFPKSSRARLRPRFEAPATTSNDEETDTGSDPVPASAALSVADSVCARLRALVPDVADQAAPAPASIEPEPELELQPEAQLEPEPELHLAPVETVAAPEVSEPEPVAARVAAAAPVPLEALVLLEADIPPPPMPWETAPHPDIANDDVWPAFTPAQVDADDPFAPGPPNLGPPHLDAPDLAPEDHDPVRPLDLGPLRATLTQTPPEERSAPISILFRPRPEHRVQIPPRSEQIGQARAPGAARKRGAKLSLIGWVALGLLIFIGSIWSIFTTNPDAVNFAAGLSGIVVMAVPAYLLLGLNGAARSGV